MNKVKMIKCPSCKKKFDYYKSESRPFCTERCKMVDLGNWFNEEYQLESREPISDQDMDKIVENLSEEN